MSRRVLFNLSIISDHESGKTFAILDDYENARSLFVQDKNNEIECVFEATKTLTEIAVKKYVREAIEEERLLNE